MYGVLTQITKAFRLAFVRSAIRIVYFRNANQDALLLEISRFPLLDGNIGYYKLLIYKFQFLCINASVSRQLLKLLNFGYIGRYFLLKIHPFQYRRAIGQQLCV